MLNILKFFFFTVNHSSPLSLFHLSLSSFLSSVAKKRLIKQIAKLWKLFLKWKSSLMKEVISQRIDGGFLAQRTWNAFELVCWTQNDSQHNSLPSIQQQQQLSLFEKLTENNWKYHCEGRCNSSNLLRCSKVGDLKIVSKICMSQESKKCLFVFWYKKIVTKKLIPRRRHSWKC